MNNDSIYGTSLKGVFHLPTGELDKIIFQTKGKILKRVFKESGVGARRIFIFPRNHRFYETFNRKLVQMVMAGLINNLAYEYTEMINKNRFKHLHTDSVEPMSLEHLEAGFVLWLISLIFPTLAFAGEWIFKFAFGKVEKKIKKQGKVQKTALVGMDKFNKKSLEESTLTQIDRETTIHQSHERQETSFAETTFPETTFAGTTLAEIHHDPTVSNP